MTPLIVIFHFSIFLYTSPGSNNQKKIFLVNKGDSLNAVSARLYSNNLITNRHLFTILVRTLKLEKQIKAGEYILDKSMRPMNVLDVLKRGKSLERMVTIPEGLSLEGIEQVLVDNGVISSGEFSRIVYDREFIKLQGLDQSSLEGYIFPDTYGFPKNISTVNVIKIMVDRFWKVFDDKLKARAKEIGFSTNETITLASIIEKETGRVTEMKIISGVFHNRLKKKIRLQSDPTTIYGIKNFDGNLKKRDLRKRTPYNTYVIRGLPPGPIASPGKQAIEAALYPDKHKFLYFVSKNNGSHYFSKTLKEHNNAVIKYQKRRRRK